MDWKDAYTKRWNYGYQQAMKWEAAPDPWEVRYQLAKRYYEEHGKLNIPAGFVLVNGKRLDIWVSRQREKYRDGKLIELAARYRLGPCV